MAELIHPDGERTTVQPANARKGFTLTELYALIHCKTVEPLNLPDGRTMLFDEDGKMNSLPNNPVATEIARSAGIAADDYISGIALIVSGRELQ